MSPTQRPLPDSTNTHKRQTSTAPRMIRTRNPSKRAAADPRLRPRVHWDRLYLEIQALNLGFINLEYSGHWNYKWNRSYEVAKLYFLMNYEVNLKCLRSLQCTKVALLKGSPILNIRLWFHFNSFVFFLQNVSNTDLVSSWRFNWHEFKL
jgi:hypothetical protein